MSLAYTPAFEAAITEVRAKRRAQWASWEWRLHDDPRFLIVSRGPGHGTYTVGDDGCNCPAGRFGRFCCHQAALWGRWRDVAAARRELA